MNRNFTSLRTSKPASFFALVAFLASTLLTISASSVSAQSADATAELSLTVDLVRALWLDATEYSAVITTERAATTQVLATPNLPTKTLALYSGYDRMLVYMQNDLTTLKVPIENIVWNNYYKVVLETPGDPTLKDMQADQFDALYKNLVEKLTHH